MLAALQLHASLEKERGVFDKEYDRVSSSGMLVTLTWQPFQTLMLSPLRVPATRCVN